MSESFEKKKAPEVPMASRSENPVFHEVHEEGYVGEVAEEKIEKTRAAILERFGVAPGNVLIEKLPEGEVRKIRAFFILRNRDSNGGWYSEGHNQHVALFGRLIEEFGDKLELKTVEDVADEDFNLRHPWETLKGFIDPYQNGFKSFPRSREALIEELRENEDINGMTDEEVEQIENGESPIPNWFLTGRESS